MNSALWKDNLREIKESIPRFISIFAVASFDLYCWNSGHSGKN